MNSDAENRNILCPENDIENDQTNGDESQKDIDKTETVVDSCLSAGDGKDEEIMEQAISLKEEGNSCYRNRQYHEAIELYSQALEMLLPQKEDLQTYCAVIYCNRAACLLALQCPEKVIEDCTAAIEMQPSYAKAFYRRALANEAIAKLRPSLEDYRKALELDPTLCVAHQAIQRLEPRVREEEELQKAEMLDKLKDLGNSLLGKFGLSLDNFKMDQDPNTGSYSVRFEK